MRRWYRGGEMHGQSGAGRGFATRGTPASLAHRRLDQHALSRLSKSHSIFLYIGCAAVRRAFSSVSHSRAWTHGGFEDPWTTRARNDDSTFGGGCLEAIDRIYLKV